MLNFFRRKSDMPDKPASTARTRPRTSSPGKPAAAGLDPPPLPEVTEGNLESDWALWEDSVAFQDSQLPSGFNELESVRARDNARKDDAPDPFAAVRGRRS